MPSRATYAELAIRSAASGHREAAHAQAQFVARWRDRPTRRKFLGLLRVFFLGLVLLRLFRRFIRRWSWSGASAYSSASCASRILRSRSSLGIGDAEVAHELLGDRRAALDHLAGFEVLDRARAIALRSRSRRARRSARPRSPPWPSCRLLRDARRSRPACGPRRRRRARACCRRRRRGSSCRPLSIGLQAESEGASAATSSTQEATADRADARRATTPPATRRAACRRRRRGAGDVGDCAASSGERVLRPGAPLRPACRRWRGCGRSLRPAAGWGSRPSCRRRGRRRCRRG